MDEKQRKQELDPTIPEGATSAYVQDVIHGGITPNPDAPTTPAQVADAALYERLRIIPSPEQVGNAATEKACIYAGLAALREAQASRATMANYLMQLYGYDRTIADSWAQSVALTGRVFEAALPRVPAGGFDFRKPNLGA